MILCQTPPFADSVPLQGTKPSHSPAYNYVGVESVDEALLDKLISSLLTRSFINNVRSVLQTKLSDIDSKEDMEKYCIAIEQETQTYTTNNIQKYGQEMEAIQKYINCITHRLLQTNMFDGIPTSRARQSGGFFRENLDIDDMNSIANNCHLYVVAGDYVRCNGILKEFISVQKDKTYARLFDKGIASSGYNFDFSYAILNAMILLQEDLPCISDLIFTQVEQSSLPIPLQTELNPIPIGKSDIDTLPGLKPTVLVDPLVYVCFLRFWCSMKLDENIEKLRARTDMVWCCGLDNIQQKAVACNLLAYCHSQLEEYSEAFAVLCRASRQRPKHCSTLVNIAVLINNKLKKSAD